MNIDFHPYPRVLVIGQDFNTTTGGGITMSCLFAEWPRDRIAVAGGQRTLGQSGFAEHYYRLGALEDRWIWPLSSVSREPWKVSGPVTLAADHRSEEEGTIADRAPYRPPRAVGNVRAAMRDIGSAMLSATGADASLRMLHLTDSFRSWAADYKPDIVYSQLAGLDLVRFVNDFASETGIPVAIHFMDDWPMTLYRGSALAPILRAKLHRELRALIGRSALLMAISNEMADAFKARYGRTFEAFHNALDLRDWETVRRTSWQVQVPFEVLYAGRIGTANQAGLLDVADAVGQLTRSGICIRLSVLTPDDANPTARALASMAHVDLMPPIAHRDIPARLAAADLLVLPLDFGEQATRFARFSMPTKTVEYMSSGTPILLYAPAQHAVCRYAISKSWAQVVGRRDQRELVDSIRLMTQSAEERERLARRAVEVALANHDADLVREDFRSALQGAAVFLGG